MITTFIKEIETMKKSKLIASLSCLVLLLVAVNQGIAAEVKESAFKRAITLDSVQVAKIDINSADEQRLTELPGIGPATATKIFEYRKVNGPFKSVDDLLNVKGIGPKVLEKIRPFVSLT